MVGGGQISSAIRAWTGGPDSYSKFSVFLSRKPTSAVEGDLWHKAVVSMSVVEGRAHNICST
jgi:hypothetical protein